MKIIFIKILNKNMFIDKLQIKRSNETVTDASTGVVSPKLPNPSDLDNGELALNYADGYETIAFKNDNGEIVEIKPQASLRVDLEDYINDTTKILPLNCNYFYQNAPITHFRSGILNFSNSNKWYGICFCVGHLDVIETKGIYISFGGDTQALTDLHYLPEESFDNAQWQDELFNENLAHENRKGLMSPTDKVNLDTLWSERSEGNTFSDLTTALSAITSYGSVCIGNKQFNLKSDNTFTWGNAYIASLAEGTYSETYGDAGNYANFSYLLNESQSKSLTLGFFLSDNSFIPYSADTNVVNVINQNYVNISFDMILYQTTLKITATDSSQNITITSVRPSSKGIIYQGLISDIPTTGLIIDYGIGGENTFSGAMLKIRPTNEAQKLNCNIGLSFKACDYRQLEVS